MPPCKRNPPWHFAETSSERVTGNESIVTLTGKPHWFVFARTAGFLVFKMKLPFLPLRSSVHGSDIRGTIIYFGGWWDRQTKLTIFSTSCGLCLRTTLTAVKTSTSWCSMACSMAMQAAQYTPTRLRPLLRQRRKFAE